MATSTSPVLRRTLGALTAVLLAGTAVIGSAGSASAEDGYRYWNYSHLEDGSFEFAQTGPGDVTPDEGAVEGWRYGTSTVSQGIAPRADLDEVTFEAVCSGTEAAEGEKRVAVLVDFGDEADADGAAVPEPVAECAVVPTDATGQQVLESVIDVRADQGMICALSGYPAQGCGEPVGDAQVSAQEQPVAFELPQAAASAENGDASDESAPVSEETQDSSFPLVGVLLLVVVLAGLGITLYRRNSDS